ncbi:MAG: hypothetical protein ISR65_12045 [Bacteriovoracaceae bacterium]|nr:hypothetical protein [Bacteriovoracaceae bacterium]
MLKQTVLKIFIVYIFITFHSLSTAVDLSNLSDFQNVWSSQGADQLTQVLNSSISSARKKELAVLRNNILKFMLHASYRADEQKYKIFLDAKEYFNKIFPRVIHNIVMEKSGIDESNFHQIISAPPWTVRDDVAFLKKEVSSLDYLGSAKSFDTIATLVDKIDWRAAGSLKVLGTKQQQSVIDLLQEFQSSATDQSKALGVINFFEQKFDYYINQIKNVGKYLAETDQIAFPYPDIKLFVQKFFNYYYQHIERDVLKDIVADIIDLQKTPSQQEVARIMFRNSGPGLGKTLQQLAKEKGMGDSMEKLMSEFESSGKKVPAYLMQELVARDKGGYVFVSIDPKPVGTGTMAQVHQAHIKHKGKEQKVALRYLKPGIEERVSQDITVLKEFLKDIVFDDDVDMDRLPNFEYMLDSIEDFLKLEVDIAGTIDRQKKAIEVYSRHLEVAAPSGQSSIVEIKIPKLFYPPKADSSTYLHVQEFINTGEKFVEIDDVDVRFSTTNAIVRTWFEEALFSSGYLHADLHQGNFKVLLTAGKKKLQVIFFDFGLATTLTRATQRAFMLIGAGARLHDAKLLANGIAEIPRDDGAKIDYAKLLNEIAEKLKKQASSSVGADEWILWGMQEKYIFNKDIGVLARGGKLVAQLPEAINDHKIMLTTLKELGLKYFKKAMTTLDYHFPLKLRDFFRISLVVGKGKCSASFSRFLDYFN